MTDFRTMFRDFAWRDLFPWLILVRAFRLSWHPGMVALALAAALASTIGWRVSAFVFVPASIDEKAASREQESFDLARRDAQVLTQFPGQGIRPATKFENLLPERFTPGDFYAAIVTGESAPQRAYRQLLLPLGGLARTNSSLRYFGFYLFGTIWSIAAWAVAGGAITRVAMVDLGREEHVSLKSAIRLALSRFGDYLAAPIYPLAGIAVVTIPAAVAGWLLRVEFLAPVAALLWFLWLAVGMFCALMLLWLAVGWPLMWCAIGAKETGDAFEGMSQSFSFSFSKPLHYLFYAVAAYMLGALAWMLVGGFVDAGVQLTRHAVSWGAGGARVEHVAKVAEEFRREGISTPAATASGQPAAPFHVTGTLVGFFEWLAYAVADAWCYSYFWVLSAGVFLLLRYDTERAELDDVWMPEEVPGQTLPEVKVDAAGVAEVRPSEAAAPSDGGSEPNTAE